MNTLVVGQHVTWLHIYRGGYGYTHRIPAVVVTIGPARVQVEVRKVGGDTVRRWVRPENVEAQE